MTNRIPNSKHVYIHLQETSFCFESHWQGARRRLAEGWCWFLSGFTGFGCWLDKTKYWLVGTGCDLSLSLWLTFLYLGIGSCFSSKYNAAAHRDDEGMQNSKVEEKKKSNIDHVNLKLKQLNEHANKTGKDSNIKKRKQSVYMQN